MVVVRVDCLDIRGLDVGKSRLGFTGMSITLRTWHFSDSTKDQLLNGATLLGVVLSLDKTNILVMTGNRMAHPLLLSLANIDSDLRSKGSLHGHILLALLPVASFIHKKSRVCILLSDRLIHESLDFVLHPLKVAATVGIMMSDPIGNLRYCFTPLVAYIADTPEQSLLACTGPKASPVLTTTHKQFSDPFPHPPRTPTKTLSDIQLAHSSADPDDFEEFLKVVKCFFLKVVKCFFLKVVKCFFLNGVFAPFWRNWPLSNPSIFSSQKFSITSIVFSGIMTFGVLKSRMHLARSVARVCTSCGNFDPYIVSY